MQQALAQGGEHGLSVALATAMLWHTYGMLRIAVLYRGRAMPRVWWVLEHGSAPVGYDTYKDLLDQAVTLLPVPCPVGFLADRGVADTALRAHLHRLGWHWRLRVKPSVGRYRRGRPRGKVERLTVAPGPAGFWPRVCIPAKRSGPVQLAVARPHGGTDVWSGIRDEPTAGKPFEAYGRRCDIAENCLADTSHGLQRASSFIRCAQALSRLCVVVAIATLDLVTQGSEVVKQGTRRLVDPHWFRGRSSLKMGWHWGTWALTRGYALITHVSLSGECDPEPAMASKCHDQRCGQGRFAFELSEAA